MGGQSRQGGKAKPLKQEKSTKNRDTRNDPKDADELREEADRRADAAKKKKDLEAARAMASGKGPLNTGTQGIKKSGKK